MAFPYITKLQTWFNMPIHFKVDDYRFARPEYSSHTAFEDPPAFCRLLEREAYDRALDAKRALAMKYAPQHERSAINAICDFRVLQDYIRKYRPVPAPAETASSDTEAFAGQVTA